MPTRSKEETVGGLGGCLCSRKEREDVKRGYPMLDGNENPLKSSGWGWETGSVAEGNVCLSSCEWIGS